MKFKLEHKFSCSLEVFNQALHDERLHNYISERLEALDKREPIEIKNEDGKIYTKLKCTPKDVIPKAAQKVVSLDMVIWIEESVHDLETGVITFTITPASFKNVFECHGEYAVKENGDHLKRTIKGTIRVKLGLAGKMVEKWLAPQITNSMNEEAKHFKTFLEKYYSQ